MEFTYTKGPNRGEIVKHWPGLCSSTDTFRIRDEAVQYWSKASSCWRDVGTVVNSRDLQTIVNEIVRLWPPTKLKVEPFGEFKWLPAGEGCVRTLMPDVYYSRVRRHPEGLEWQRNPRYKDRTWDVNGVGEYGEGDWPSGAKAALDHFWPLAPAKSKAPKEAIAWQFKTTPDKVDVARCLREAYDAGAREVTIDNDGLICTWIHHSIQPLASAFRMAHGEMEAYKYCSVDMNHLDWCHIDRPCLEQARAWEAEQKAKSETKIVVKVKGVR
jgi:hypothetical protein